MTSNDWWMHLLWVFAAGVVGFGITAVCAGRLKLRRGWLVLAYALIAGAFLTAYLTWIQTDLLEELRRHWLVGIAGAVVVGFLMVRNVLSQPSSLPSEGVQLAFDLVWSGAVYGVLDGVFLSVMPLLASRQAFADLGWSGGWLGTVGAALAGMLASSYVTAAYHLGYPEFRGSAVVMPILGNDIMSLGTILTGNPLTAVLSHGAMHMAAVLHGMEATIQLPPHY